MVMTRSAVAKKKSRSALAVALPREVVVDIVGILAASSPQPMADLCNLRPTCKDMYGASKERHVGRRLALEKERTMKWRDNMAYFAMLENLADAGNPEACFIVGLTLVFTRHNKQRGLVCLDQAAAGGHKEAAYVLGMLLYTLKDGQDVAKRYIGEVEGDVGCNKVTTEKTNWECRKYKQLAANAVREVAWKGITNGGQPVLLPMLPEDGHRCTSARCGVPEDWADYDVFCGGDCRIRHECVEFFGQVSRYLP
ncbi:hypothetical protein ACQ4PT_069996 [Festuca glaucescens]